MRWLLLCLPLVACALPRQGSSEWLAKSYSNAFLKSDEAALRQHAAEGAEIKDQEKNPHFAAMHVIRLCDTGGNAARTQQRFLVLVGTNNQAGVHGIDLVTVKEGEEWRVRNAKIATTPDGEHQSYRPDCSPMVGIEGSGPPSGRLST